MDRRDDWNNWKKQNGVSSDGNVGTQTGRSGGSNPTDSGNAVSRRDDWENWKKENNAEAKAFVQNNLPGITLAGTNYINKLNDALTDVAGGVAGLGKSGFNRDFDEYDKQAKRFERDSKLYPEMASQAVKTGNPTLYAQALEGMTNRVQQYENAAARIPDAQKAYMENLKQTNPAAYYGQTMEQSEIEKNLYAARGQLDKAKANRNGPIEARPEDAPRGYQVIDLAEQQMEGASGASVERLRENWQAQEQEELGRKRDAEIEELSGQVKMWESARRIRADYDDYQEKSKAAREIEQEARKSEDFAELSDPYSKKLYRLMSYIDDNEHRMLYNAMTEEEKAVYHWLWAKYADDASMYTLIQEYEKKPDIQERYKAASADNRYKLNSEDDIFRNAARVWNYIKDSVYSGANRGIQGILAWINPAWEPYMEGYRPHEEELANAMSRMSPGYRALGGAAQSVGQMLPSIAAGKLAGALVSAFPTAVTALGGLTKGAVTAERIIRWTQNAAFFMSSAGAARQEAKERYGMNAEQAEVFSVLSGLSEVYLQNVIGGIAAFGGIGEQELAARIDLIENAMARTVLHGGLNVLGEELEENTQNFLEPLFVTMLTGADYQTPTAEETLETFLSTLFMVSSMNAGDSVSVYKSAKYENNLKALAKGCRELGGEYELVANQIDSLLGAARENPEMWITKEDFLAATDLKAMAEERMQKSGTSAQEVGEALAAAVKERTDGQEQRQAGSEDNGAPERETSAAPEQSETEAGELRQIYEQTLAQTEENAQEVETGRLQRIAAAVEQNLQEAQNTAAPQELARMRGELDGLKNEIVRRQGVTDDVTGVDWIGNREETDGQIARATGETGVRPMTARADVGIGPYGDGGRIAADAGLAMKGNGTGTQNDVAGVDWIGNREETGGQVARATGDNGGQVARATGDNGGQIARATEQEDLNNGYSGNTENRAGLRARFTAEGPADGVQRDAGLGAEGQAGGLGEGTGGSVGRSQKSQELAQLRNYVQARADQRRGSAALGVLDGTNKVNNILIEGEGLTRPRRAFQADAARDGVRVSFVTGTIETVMDGVRRTGGGVFQIDRDGTPHLFIQADSRSYSPRQIYDHERFHAIVAANRGVWSDIVEHLYETHSTEEIRQMVDAYVQAYDGCYGYEEADAEKYLEEIFADVYAEMQRGGGQQRAARELAGDTAQRFAGDIENARQNRAGIDNRNGPGTRLSFAGKNAETANVSTLDEAQRRIAEGEDSETVRQETGWYRGMDGKWRFEIDDSGMEYRSQGDMQSMQDPEYREYLELWDKIIARLEGTEAEMARLRELDKRFSSVGQLAAYKLRNGTATLQDIIHHDALFQAYPMLRDIHVQFAYLKPGVNASYDQKNNTIQLSYTLEGKPAGSLIHEIQHAIQEIEGFAAGSNMEQWTAQIKAEGKKEISEAEEEVRRLFDALPEYVKGEVRKYNQANSEKNYDLAIQIEDELYSDGYGDMFSEYMDAVVFLDLEKRRQADLDLTAESADRYYRTAGEIEARDSANRLGLDAEQRKNTRPDIDRKDVVFTREIADTENDIQLSESDEEDYKKYRKLISETVTKAIEQQGQIDQKYNQQKISAFPEKTAQMVLKASSGDIDVSGKTLALNGSEIYHEYIRHSDPNDANRGQVPLTKRRFVNAIRAVYNPDIVECLIRKNISGTVRQSFAYVKKTARGNYLVVEAVGGKRNPNVCPIEIFEVASKTWKKYMQEGLSIGEILYKNDAQKLQALDIEKNKKNRVTATQFASEEAIAHTSRSPRSGSIIVDEGENVKQMFSYTAEDDALSVGWIGNREEKAANKGSYKWSEIRGRVSGMNEGQRKALVEQAAELDEATWRENGLGIKPYSGSLNDTEAILKYVDDAVDTVKAEGSYDYDPSFDIEALGENKESYSRLSAAAEDDALSADWLGNREETTPSPQGKGAAEDGGPMKASAPTGENFEAMAREKKVALAEKTGIDGLKSRIKNAEERMRMWQAMEKSGLAAQDAKSVQELKNRIADAQETVNIFREELARKQDAKKAARTDPAMKQERAVRRRDEKAALRKETELADNKPRQARKEFRQDALNLFGIQAGKRQALGNILNSFADRLLAQGSVSEADRADLFRQLYEAGVEVVPAGALERMVRETVKDGRIYVPESVRQEFGDDWTAFRERAWGNGIYLTNNQSDRGADSWNAELAEVFPGSFDAEETDARNMLENIVDLAEEGKAEFVSIGEMMKRNQAETGVTVDQQMDELEQKVDKLIDTFAQKAQLEIDVRKQGTMKLVKERQRNRETAAREVQRRKENATRSQVMKQLQQLNKMRKKSEPVIQKQIDAIIGNLDIMARSISPEGMENLQALARKYMEAAEDPNFLGNPYVEARLARLNKVQLDNLEISDVIELGRTISALVKSVTEDKRLLTDTRNREIADAAADVRREVESSAGSHSGKLGQFYSTEHLSPTRELQKLGGWVRGGQMESLSRALEDGGTKRLEYMRQANRIFDGFLSDKNNQKWLRSAQGKHAEWIQIKVPTGYVKNEAGKTEMGWKPLEITPMMRVALLMHSRNVDNLRHIETGGIVIPDKAEYIKGNKQEALARGTRVKMRPETVRAIVKDCTAQELAFAKLLEQYYDGFSKNKINEVSMLIDGFERAGGEHYYGIKVSQDFLAKQPESVKMDMSLESIGSIVNERIHAGNPIILEDATDALTSHIDLISKYYGFAAPIRDFNAVMNYTFHEKGKTAAGEEYVANAFETSVRETLRQKWGDGAQKYIDKLLSDLQQSKGSSDLMGSFLAKLRGNLAGASLTFNAAVALSQTASLPGAMQTLGLGGVTAALKPEKVDMKLVEKYTPILWYRNQGNSTQELGDYMKEQGITGKMPWFFNWIQKMDSWTIRRIWAGAEYRVSKDTDLAPGSKEEIEAGTDPYYQEVARVFNRAVYDTQPNYSEMQRPGILRSESDLTKSLTMYKTVPLQYYNMMYEAVGRLRADSERAKASPNDRKAQADLKESKNFAAKTFVGILGANVTYVVMKALVKALTGRGKKYQDDDGKYTPDSVLGRLGLDLTETYAGSIIGGSDLLNAGEKLYGAITTGKYSSYGGTEISMISAIEDTLGELYNLAAKLHKEDYTGGIGAVKELAKQLAVDFGFPANNMETYLLAMTKWISPEWADRYENFFDEFQRADLKGEHGRNLTAAVRVLMDNRTDGLSDDAVDELVRLWESGKIMQIPNAVPWSVSVGGNDITLGSEGRSKFREEWSRYVSSGLDSLIKDKAYRKASDADKAAMIKKLYDFATAAAKKSTVIGYEPDKWVNVGIAAVKAGVPTAQYVVFAQQLKTINGKDDDGETITGLKNQRSVELLRDTGWTDAQQELVYLQSSMTSDSAAARVQGLRDAGLTWDQTCDVVSTVGGDWAKATAIIDSDASNSAKLKALEYYLSGSTLRTAQVGVDYHVDLKLWADARTQADTDGNGSINQAEATAYLDELNVSWEDKAYIWQMVCYTSKWAKNPYSTTLGEDIWHSLHPDD